MRSAAAAALLLGLGSTAAAGSVAADGSPCPCAVTPAACDAGCACDPECAYDWTQDECADPAAGCQEELEATEEELDAIESLPDAEPEPWDPATDPWESYAPGALECPEYAEPVGGRCVDTTDAETLASGSYPDEAELDEAAGGGACAVAGGGALPSVVLVVALLALLVLARRLTGLSLPLLLAIVVLACVEGDAPPPASWDEAATEGPDETEFAGYIDIYEAELQSGAGSVLVPAFHAAVTVADHLEPTPVFALASARLADGEPVRRVPGAAGCGDRLVAGGGPEAGELIGYAAWDDGPGRAELVELDDPDGCGALYVTIDEPAELDSYLAEGYARGASLGYAWPVGWGAPPVDDDGPLELAFAPGPCSVTKRSRLFVLSSDLGDEVARLAAKCSGEIVVGSTGEDGPPVAYRNEAWQAAGLRSGFVVGDGGAKLKALLETRGVEKTAAYLKKKLKSSPADRARYDYIILDGLGADPAWAANTATSRKLRKLLLRLPKRSVIAHVARDVAASDDLMSARGKVFRSLHRRGRAIGLGVNVPAASVLADGGEAARLFRQAARRLDAAARPHGVKKANRWAITVVGLDQGASLGGTLDDGLALLRQGRALKMAGGKLGQQRGVGFAYASRDSLLPSSGAYGLGTLVGWLAATIRCASGKTSCGTSASGPVDEPRCLQGSFTAYHGDLHSHTGHSDGEPRVVDGVEHVTSPADAFRYAREGGRVDYYVVTDHRRKLTRGEYGRCWEAADAETSLGAGAFVAACGWEESNGAGAPGHANVLFLRSLRKIAKTTGQIYAEAEKCDGCVVQINHPNSGRNPWPTFGYRPKANRHLPLIETNGVPLLETWETYLEALRKGWHLAPTRNGDTHQPRWGDGEDRTGVWLTELTRDELRRAMLEHRVFASEDRTATLKIAAGGCFMGSVIRGGASATVEVVAADAEDDGFGQIVLYGPAGPIGAPHDCAGAASCVAEWPIAIVGATWVVALATQADGDHLGSAPIWFQP